MPVGWLVAIAVVVLILLRAAIRLYNGLITRRNNIGVESFPGNIVAGPLGFNRRVLFEAAAGERDAVPVGISSG